MTYGSVPYGTGSSGSYPAGACLTVKYLVDRTFDLLLQSAREERNQLTGNLDTTTTTTTFNVNFALGSLTRGTYLAIDDEVCYVWSAVAGSGSTSTVTGTTVSLVSLGTAATLKYAGTITSVGTGAPTTPGTTLTLTQIA